MKKIAILISGSGSNLGAIIDACDKNIISGEVSLVISNNPNAYGLKRALNKSIETIVLDHRKYKSRDEFDNELEHILKRNNFDLIVLAGFMRILGEKITKKFNNKMINLHPSLLPLYPGLNTHEKVIKNNEKIHGISIHYVSNELDAGPLIAQGIIKIKGDDSVETVTERIHKIEHDLLPDVIKEICDEKIYFRDGNVQFSKDINTTNGIIVKKYDV